MKVEIVQFPETRLAVVEHRGSPEFEQQTIQRLIQWRKANQVPPSAEHRTYGLHYNDFRHIDPNDYRLDVGVSVGEAVELNPFGVINKVIPASRCAKARHLGSRERVLAAEYLYDQWLPNSGEEYSNQPIIFHYVNIGTDLRPEDMITDVYLPLVPRES